MDLLPFLKIGHIFDFFQSLGISLVSIDLLNNNLNGPTTISLIFNAYVDVILSIPGDLLTLNSAIAFSTSSFDIKIHSKLLSCFVYISILPLFSLCLFSILTSLLKTEQKWLLSIIATSLSSFTNSSSPSVPLLNKGPIFFHLFSYFYYLYEHRK